MIPTSVSLLDRLKTARPEATDWKRLQEVYHPLIRRWLRRVPGLEAEVEDLAQEVFVILVRGIPSFEREREGSFRAWLRVVTVNKARSHYRRRRPVLGADETDGFLDRLVDPNDDLAREWDREHDKHVTAKLLEVVQPDFRPETWRAFRAFALEGRPASEVASELGVTVNAVIQAKARILKRLRVEAGDLLA